MLKKSITRFICQDDQDRYYLLRSQLAATGKLQSCELCMLKSDGTQLWALLQASVSKSPSDMLVYRIILSDITARNQVEQDNRIAATVFESTEGMMITDGNQIILRVNKAFTDITGYASADVLGQIPKLLRSGCPDEDTYEAMWLGIALRGAWQGEVWNRRKNGEVYPARLTVTAVRNDKQVVTRYVATLSDISARRTAEEKIRNLAFYDPLTQCQTGAC